MTRALDDAPAPEERDLRTAAAARELDLALGEELRRADDVARTEATLRAEFASAPPRARPTGSGSHRVRFLALAAVAIASIAVGFVLWRNGSEPADPWSRRERLGAFIERIEPLDAPVAEFTRFAWRMPRGSQDVASVEVLAPDGTLVATSPRSVATIWTPTDTSAWPSRIVWRVRAFDASGAELVSPSWSASRSH